MAVMTPKERVIKILTRQSIDTMPCFRLALQ
jgi:hypothetical protein